MHAFSFPFGKYHSPPPSQALFPLFPHGQNLETLEPSLPYGQGKEVTLKRSLNVNWCRTEL